MLWIAISVILAVGLIVQTVKVSRFKREMEKFGGVAEMLLPGPNGTHAYLQEVGLVNFILEVAARASLVERLSASDRSGSGAYCQIVVYRKGYEAERVYINVLRPATRPTETGSCIVDVTVDDPACNIDFEYAEWGFCPQLKVGEKTVYWKDWGRETSDKPF